MTNKKLNSVIYFYCNYPQYARNSIFLKGLKQNNIKVHEFNLKHASVLKTHIKSVLFFIKNLRKLISIDNELIIIYSQPPIHLIFAKILAIIKGVPLVNDIFFSKLETKVYDRNLYNKPKLPKFLFKAYYFISDELECFLSDYIILDTMSHIKFFHEKFNISLKKFRKVLVGAQDNFFFPREKNKKESNIFVVGFWGSSVPLHGISYMIKSAKLLEKHKDIKFIMIGDGQTYEEDRKLAKSLDLNNIKFIPGNFVVENRLEELAELLSEFDIGLGIFGTSSKAQIVIPNKIYEGIAMKIPMINSNTPAIREEFTGDHNIILCERADPSSLAKAILRLKDNPNLRREVTDNGYKLFKQKFSIEKIGKSLVQTLNKILIKENK